MLMITFLTLQCNLIWNDVMQAVVLVPKHISIPMLAAAAALDHLLKGRKLTVVEGSQVSLRSLHLSAAC